MPAATASASQQATSNPAVDSEGNAWNANNMQAGSQTLDSFWQGTVSKFAPDGKPLSPALTGFTGGGLLGPGFGLAIDANDNAWLTSFAGNGETGDTPDEAPLTAPLHGPRSIDIGPDGTMTIEIEGHHVGVGSFASARAMTRPRPNHG
jgi:hypothetical protein